MSISLAANMERRGPAIFAIVVLILYFAFALKMFAYAEVNKWDLGALYSAIFDTASMTAAFLFSFFVFIKTTSNDFLSAFRKEPAYGVLMRHFKWSIISSFVLALVTILCLVTTPHPLMQTELNYWLMAVWFTFVAYVIAATIRSAYQFVAVLDAAYSKRFGA